MPAVPNPSASSRLELPPQTRATQDESEDKNKEQSQHTSVKQRVKHVRKNHGLWDLDVPKDGSVGNPRRTAGFEEDHWLWPIEDCRNHVPCRGLWDRDLSDVDFGE